MKKYILLATVLLLISALVGGATLAVFTDGTTNTSQVFSTGTVAVDVERDLGDPVPGPMFYSFKSQGAVEGQDVDDILNPTGLWAPGDTHTRLLHVINTGSLAFRISGLSAEIYNVTDEEAEEFAEHMNVRVYYNIPGEPVLYEGPLADYLAAPVDCIVRPQASSTGSIIHIAFEASLDIDAGDIIQGTEPMVDFFVYVEQVKNNPYSP
ncbi:CalY family protein [Dethiobacter alkaliphilus]|uniref:CalY family protein n=1 Tax=Dethiobacter alkaliphilus TaxID=427926 RepID=UPI0022267C37|nr:CalY family protein [Dethiobacter alkaliphilus]MCW3490440.1 CalY family protein [Dethiobacter alkaliphilus]